MRVDRRLFGVGFSVALLAAQPAGAFAISDVALFPEQPDATSFVSLSVSFVTSSSSPFLFAPTVVEIDGFSIDVELFAGAGLLQVPGSAVVLVELGVLPPGPYDFVVRLTPEFDATVGRDHRLFTGSFQVVPEPAPLALALVGLLTLAGARRKPPGRRSTRCVDVVGGHAPRLPRRQTRESRTRLGGCSRAPAASAGEGRA